MKHYGKNYPKYKGKSKPKHKGKNKNMVAKKEIIVYAPKKSLMPFPPKYRTKLVCEADFVYPAATYHEGHFAVQLNSPYLPFINYGTGTNTVITSGAAILGPNLITTMLPTGYSQLLNANLYNSYKCHASKIYVEMLVGAQGDSTYVSITPSQTQADPPSYMIACTQPLTTKGVCFSGKNNEGDISKSQGTLKNYQKVRTVLGLTKIQEEADTFLSATAFNSANIESQLYWIVNWQTADDDLLAVKTGLRVRIEYYITCWNQSAANLAEV